MLRSITDEEVYAIWMREWKKQKPTQQPPTLEQMQELMREFKIGWEDILGVEE